MARTCCSRGDFQDHAAEGGVTPADCALFAGLSGEELALLERLLVRRTYHKGQTIIAAGQSSDELFVITEGAAMVTIPTQDGIARLQAFSRA